MRLLIVCQAVDVGHQNLGFFVRWIEELAKQCESIEVITNQVGVYQLPDNVRVHSLGKEEGVSRMERYLRFYSLIADLSGAYDTVFCHMNPEFVIAGAPLWRMWGKKVALWYVHGAVSWRLRLALLFAHIAFTVNEESLKVKSAKIHIVGHGIDTDFFKPGYRLKHDEALVISAGRVTPTKHIDDIIEAIRLVHDSGVAVRATIIGGPLTELDRAYEERITMQARDLLYIKLVGPQTPEYVRDAVASADICINASTTNSVDKAVLEAMSAGSVPITSNVAFSEMLAPHGLFVEERTPGMFADRLESVLARNDLEALRTKLRAEIVVHHNLKDLIHKITDILEHVRN